MKKLTRIRSKVRYESNIHLLRLVGLIFGFTPRRADLAKRYISGEGIEIGALSAPLLVKKSTKVSYVDNQTFEQNELNFPELKGRIVKPDYIDNGFILSKIPDDSQDFLIANHVLEHSNNTIQTLINWGRVLKIGGILFIGIPIYSHCFDRGRKLTSLEHMVMDYEYSMKDPDRFCWRNKDHYFEWLTISEPNILRGEGLSKISRIPMLEDFEVIDQKINSMTAQNDEIHFHTFSPTSFKELVNHFSNHYEKRFEILTITGNIGETIAILKRIS